MRLILCCAALMAGCNSAPKIPEVVRVPVPISCVKEAPEKPATTDEATILGMTDYAATITIWSERLELRAYAEKAEVVINACR